MEMSHCAHAISQVVGDELLLLERSDGRLHRLNATAAWIYERCDGNTSEAIAAELASRYEVDESVALRDVEDIAMQLARLGLIRLVDRTIVEHQVD
jgi:hypothetical protein